MEFDDPDDAAEAIFNLHGSELYGRTLNVSVAQPHQVKLGSKRAVWITDECTFIMFAGVCDCK